MNRLFIVLFTACCLIFTGIQLLSAGEESFDEFTLEEITVTAQKREEDQQKVPIAMETITGEQMAELGHNDIDEILSGISNAIINKSGDGMRVSLRGLADDSGVSNMGEHTAGPTVAINMDGAYNNRSDAGQALYDVERVEVLFGPQSTMYASNSPGGIVNIITSAPKTDKYEVSGSLEYGNYNLLRTEGSMNAPLSDKVALRAAFSTSVRDGYLSNGAEDEDTKSARLKMLYQPSDMLSFTLTGQYSLKGGNGFASVTAFGDDSEVGDDAWNSDESLKSMSDEHTKSISANIDWDLGFGSLSVVPSYSRSTSEGTETSTDQMSGETTTTDNYNESTQKGAEARMTSSADFFFQWILGANYYKSSSERMKDTQDSAAYSQAIQGEKARAFFGNITYPITDTFRATAGYRKSWDTLDSYQMEAGKVDANHPDGWDQETDTTTDYSNPDYKVGAEYDVGDNMMLYANWSTSYRMQGMGMSNADGETAPPEKLNAYTLGSKNRFFGNKLQLNAAAYYYKYKNKTASQMKADYIYESGAINGYSDLDINGDGDYDDYLELHDQNSQSWGDFRTIGVDIQTDWIITSKDKLNLTVSYMNAEWSELIFDYEYDYFYPLENYKGVTNTFAPEWTVNATYSRNFTLANGGTLTARINVAYQSEYILSWSENDAPYNYQEAHHTTNIYTTYAHPDGKWTISGYVKNAENYPVKTSYQDQNGLMIGAPRTYGAVLTVKY